MAMQMNEANYHAMIQALYNFGARIGQMAEDLGQIATSCIHNLGDEDASVSVICAEIEKTRNYYNHLVLKAVGIANAMQEELDHGELERMIWEYENDDSRNGWR